MITEQTFPTEEIEKIIGYSFKNPDLLKQAFTRTTFCTDPWMFYHNEELEFIGDSILGMIVVKYLTEYYGYVKNVTQDKKKKDLANNFSIVRENTFFCHLDEAELSQLKIRLVQRSSLAVATDRMGIAQYLRMGSEDIHNNAQEQDSIKEDLFEALLGALALDSNWSMNILERFVIKFLDIDSKLENGFNDEPDYTKQLDEWSKSQNFTLEFRDVYIDNQCGYSSSIDLSTEMLSHIAFGYGKTIEGAHLMVAKRAMSFIDYMQDRTSAIINAVGAPDLNRAINQLQELYQKKIISEPEYLFTQKEATGAGNPQWECTCGIMDLTSASYTDTSKSKAKKVAAFGVMNNLIGRDFDLMLLEYDNVIPDNITNILNNKEDN